MSGSLGSPLRGEGDESCEVSWGFGEGADGLETCCGLCNLRGQERWESTSPNRSNPKGSGLVLFGKALRLDPIQFFVN